MRVVGILLQAVVAIIALVALGVYAISPAFSLGSFLLLAAAMSFLYLLTLWLREQTEERLTDRPANPRVFASILALLGLGLCMLAYEVTNGYTPARRYSLLRTAIELVGPGPPAIVLLVVAAVFLWLAYRLFRGD